MPIMQENQGKLAKSAPIAILEPKQPENIALGSSISNQNGVMQWDGIPLDVLRHFGEDIGGLPTKNIEQLRDITEWAKSQTNDEPSVGNILQKIAEVQRKLGSPSLNEKAYTKVWQFIKFQKVIDDTRKRQDALRSSPWL